MQMGRTVGKRGKMVLRTASGNVDIERMVRVYGAEVAGEVLQYLIGPARWRFKRALRKAAAS